MGIKYTDFAIRGIDVSTFNGVIDWTNMPANFASIRVGYGRTLDTRFHYNWNNCKVNKFGYWYMDYYNNYISSHPVNGMSNENWGKEQAETCYKFMGGKEIVFLDIESTNGTYAPKIEAVRTRVLEIAKAFLIRYDQLNGKKNGIYCSWGLLNWFDNWFKDRPLWVALYPYREYNTPTMSIIQKVIDKGWYTKPLIWQYASDGIINDDGIKAGKTYFKTQVLDMDLNGWVGTQSQYEQMFSTTTPDVIPPIEIPEPLEIMNIEPLSQQDPRWKDNRLGTSKTTIGGYGCLITCASMMLKWAGHDTDPARLNTWLTQNGGYVQGNLFVWDSLKGLKQGLTFINRYSGAALDKIDESLAKKMPVIIHVDYNPATPAIEQHWVLVVGRQGSSYIINDPKDGQQVKFEDRYGDPAKKIYNVSVYAYAKPDDETEVIPVTNTRVIEVKESIRTLTLRKRAEVSFTTYIKQFPVGTKFDCLEKKIDSKGNTWQRVGIDQYIADVYDGVQYLR